MRLTHFQETRLDSTRTTGLGDRGHRTRGFTLIELLIAATITLIVAGLMLTVVVNVLSAWTRSHGLLATESEARLVLDQISTDLQGALYRNDGNVWLAATVQKDTGASGRWVGNAKPATVSVNPATVAFSDCQFGLAGLWLRFITAHPASATDIGAPVAVGYQIIRQGPLGPIGEAHYLLYRSEVSPANTFAAGYNLDPATGAYTSGNVAEGSTGNLIKPPPLRVIADNVVDFGVRFYSRDASTGSLTLSFPLSDTDLVHLASEPPAGPDMAKRFPDVADVLVRVLTSDGAKLLQAFETAPANFPGQDWWKLVLANSKVYTRRIELHPSPL